LREKWPGKKVRNKIKTQKGKTKEAEKISLGKPAGK
jgi:hypothetical protein